MATTFLLTIEKYAPPGLGLGFYAGRAVFVAGAVVGDELEVEVEKEKKRYYIARLKRVIRPGPDRQNDPCPHFPACGGCDLLQLAYSEQIRLKTAMLHEQLAGAGLDVDPLPQVVAAAAAESGRYRAFFHYDAKARSFGFHARRRHRVIRLATCQALAPGLRELLAEAHRCHELTGKVTGLYGLVSSRGEVAAGLARGRKIVPLAGFPTALEEDYGVGEITLAAAGFAQANPLMTRKLLADLLALLPSPGSLLELYGGSGTFSLALAARCRRLEVWESEAAALERNRRNLSRHGFGDVKLVRARVGAARLPRDCEIVVLDPPRTGLPVGVVEELKASRAREIFYISCNPATLARDLSRLQAATAAVPGFSLQTLRAYDMYPGTTHLELLAHLVR